MPYSDPTLVLFFGPFDPSGSGNLPAQTITCSRLGGHALSVITAIHVQDTASVEDIYVLSPELVDDQARSLLEDVNVQAIMSGPIYSVETVHVLAQIAADYSQLPLIVQLGTPMQTEHDEDNEPEDILAALFELLLPQTKLVIAEHSLLAHWQNDGLLPLAEEASAAQLLLNCGAQWVLTSGTPLRPGHNVYLLQGPEQATFNWVCPTLDARLNNPDGPLSCAATLELAQGLSVPQAIEAALKKTTPMLESTFQPGMGYRIINQAKQHD